MSYLETVRGDDGLLNIVLEFVEGGSILSLLKKFGGRFPEALVAIFTLQLVQGLEYLHANDVVHRDIKGANVLATKNGQLKLADFGGTPQLFKCPYSHVRFHSLS